MQPRFTGSKSRPTARKRLNADDSPFIGPSPAAKRGVDKLDGVVEPRVKRKRVDAHHTAATSAVNNFSARATKGADGEPLSLTVDFHSFPLEALYRYLVQADAVPNLYPCPGSAENPPVPSSLLNPQLSGPRAPSPTSTPANRPRRDPKDARRRRSSRLLEEEERNRRAPILADALGVRAVLATLAERHFEKQTVREGEALQQFIHKTAPG